MILSSLIGIVLLCLTHLLAKEFRLSGIPRSKWLSVAGGISVTYIFIRALPELKEFQEKFEESAGNEFSIPGFEGVSLFVIALLGLVFFYGLENRAKKSVVSARQPDEGEETEPPGFFWIHVSSFSVYNFIIGYLLLQREDQSIKGTLIYAVAMAFHFIVTDHALEDHFRDLYRKRGRWLLIFFLLLGWIISLVWTIPEFYIGIIFSFLAGGVIMNVLKEELPRERESNFLAFFGGIFVYAVILALL